jgi:3-oxoacyl-[acyl-carrier protein] reductase
MDFGLKGKAAIVTGGSRGLGRAEAEALAAEGAAVAIVSSKSMAEAEGVARSLLDKGCRAISIQADVTQTAQVQRLVKTTLDTFGRLDILVNNAGITGRGHAGPLVELPEESWDLALSSHLRSVFLCIKYAVPHMLKQKWGRIINTSSIHGRVGGRPSFGAYGAAKAGVIALTKTAAREFGPMGVTANAIAPGLIGTQIPRGRIGEPPEVGRVVAFLASEAAAYINGAVLDIHGGRVEYFFS